MNTFLKQQIENIEKKIQEAQTLMSQDTSFAELAQEEIKKLEEEKVALQSTVNTHPRGVLEGTAQHHPGGDGSSNNVILEIRAAAGGDEAGLFAQDLYRMYTKYASAQKWRIEELDRNEGGLGNIKEVIAKISGPEIYQKLKWESGVHRVQRVPKTESAGRIHTSTATVAVLPEVAKTDVVINPADIEFEAFRSGGHGGQNVNKVSTAVRIRHKPSGLVVKAQTERSQSQNREIAMAILRAKLHQMEVARKQLELRGQRSAQLGTGDRSEKIRTYNFPQNRLTEHRIGKSWHDLENIMEGNLNKVLSALQDS